MINDPVLVNDWHPVAHTRELDEKNPLGVRLLGEDVVLWRAAGDQRLLGYSSAAAPARVPLRVAHPDGGLVPSWTISGHDQILAWQDLCVHRGTRLSLGKVEDNTLQCPYHGWTYNEEARCIRIPAHPDQAPPAKARVKSFNAKLQYDLVWVSLGDPQQDIPPFPEWDDARYRKILCGPYRVNASAPRVVENFLDVGHFPFVHQGILGDQNHPEIEDYESEIGADGVISKGVRVYQPDPYGTGIGDVVTYTYCAFRPLTAYLIKESEGPRFSLLLTITPHEAVGCTAWMWMAMNYGYEIPERDLVTWQDTIFGQDRPILESQRPEMLPLDLQAELHLRSDRTAIAYRKWLKELGLTFGAA